MFNARRVVLSLLVAGAFVLIVVGFSLTKETDPKVTITDTAVLAVYPAGGNLDLRQAVIGFKLHPAYKGRLVVDGAPIPDDQLREVVGVNDFLYQPGPGTETGALEPGRHQATVILWRRGQEERTRSYSWTFTSH